MGQNLDEYQASAAVLAIIANCKRLIADTEILYGRGSHGSALSLAILAFEEAGKGHREEMDLTKTKKTPSWHQFRQIVSAFALQIAVLNKYNIDLVDIPEHIASELRARQEGAKTTSEAFKRPIPDELRKAISEASAPASKHLSEDQAGIAELELRYVRQILEAAARGEVEEARQRGMYVDVVDGQVTSDPAQIGQEEVYRWIFAAKRTLLLLETGDFMSPFSPLAARIESRLGALPDSDGKVLEFYKAIADKVIDGEDFIDVYFSTLPESEQNDLKSYLPHIKSLVRKKFPEAFGDRAQAPTSETGA